MMNDKIALDLLNSIKEKSGKISDKSIEIHNTELFHYMKQRFHDSDNIKISEGYYRLLHGLEEAPKCPVCGKSLPLLRGNFLKGSHKGEEKGYAQYCCKSCKDKMIGKSISESYKKKDKDDFIKILEKRKKSCLEKYGKESVAQVDKFKEKSKQTCLEKYGVEYSFQSENNKKKCIDTLIRKYGSIEKANESRLNNTRKTVFERYGSNCYWSSEKNKSDLKSRQHDLTEKRWKDLGYDIRYIKDDIYEIHNQCEKHPKFEINLYHLHNRVKGGIVVCPICNPIGQAFTSSQEVEICNFLDLLGIEYEKHNRKIIKGHEIDIYIPSHKLAIECNGVYWHSEKYLDNNYHQYKSDECEKQDIQLLHIWEDLFLMKKELIFDIIKSKLGLNTRIFARKCNIKEVSSKESHIFLDENHLQGNINASIRIGLYYNNELVSIMTFGKYRKPLGRSSKDYCYELYRFCNKRGYSIIGAAGKLLSYFKKNYEWNEILTYASRDISNGNLYDKLGFTFIEKTRPNYYWVNQKYMIRENRFKYRKSEISDETNKDLSESEIMKQKNYFKCFDSGNLKYIMTNDQ